MPKVDQEGRVGSNQYVWDGSAWRRKAVRLIPKIETRTGTVNSGGGYDDYVVTADEGEVWRLVGIQLHVLAPSGATSGNHSFQVVVRPDGSSWLLKLYLESAYGDNCTLYYNYAFSATNRAEPPDAVSQTLTIKSIYIGGDADMLIRYANNTNADQTNPRYIRLQFVTV